MRVETDAGSGVELLDRVVIDVSFVVGSGHAGHDDGGIDRDAEGIDAAMTAPVLVSSLNRLPPAPGT